MLWFNFVRIVLLGWKRYQLFSLIRKYDWYFSLNNNNRKFAKWFLKYFSHIRGKLNSGLLLFDWLTNLETFTPLPCSASCYRLKQNLTKEECSAILIFCRKNFSRPLCKMSCGQFYTCAPHLYFEHLLTSHLPHHPLPAVCIHSGLAFPQSLHHAYGRLIPMLPTLDQHLQ